MKTKSCICIQKQFFICFLFLFAINSATAQFKKQSIIVGLMGKGGSIGVWGDYNNDGYLDILLAGNIYKNNGDGTFSAQTGISLTGSGYTWGDYNNDGYLDILLTGLTDGSDVSKIYKNNGGGIFSEQTGISLSGVLDGSGAWGDYNNDGYLDILLTGSVHNSTVSKIYKNNGDGTFSEQTGISLTGVRYSSGAWGDYNNDGYLDILLAGSADDSDVSKIYKNNGNGTFSEQTGNSLTGVYFGSVAWGDYNNDGYLDILSTGYKSDFFFL